MRLLSNVHNCTFLPIYLLIQIHVSNFEIFCLRNQISRIDMNEPSNFCQGCKCTLPPNEIRNRTFLNPSETPATACALHCLNSCTKDDKFTFPPYMINNSGRRAPLGEKTVSPSAIHYNDIVHYDAHNLYGIAEAIATNQALIGSNTTQRPFVLSRSTFVGSGRWASHWTGDNASTWKDLRWSLVSVLNSNIFGLVHSGADICGFLKDTTEELCARWIALGALTYSFARSHCDIHAKPQEPYLWSATTIIARKAIRLRLALVSYLYTLHYLAHTKGAPVIRPTFFEFPKSNYFHSSPDEQAMLGDKIMVCPVLYEGSVRVNCHLPEGKWYDLHDFAKVKNVSSPNGKTFKFDVPLTELPPMFILGGSIVPMQLDVGLTVADTDGTDYTLIVALDTSGKASGCLFLDAEDTSLLHSGVMGYFNALIAEKTGSVTFTAEYINEISDEFVHTNKFIEKIVILGLPPSKNFLTGEVHPPSQQSSVYIGNAKLKDADVKRSQQRLELRVHINVDLPFKIHW